MSATVENTYGILLLGAMLGCGLSGMVTVQSVVYIKLYPRDPMQTKIAVASVWLLDTLHTIFLMASIWDYIIHHFGDFSWYDFIPTTLALTIATTAILTFVVHCFLIRRIYMLTKYDWRITGPIIVLVVLRLAAAAVTTAEMIITQSFTLFAENFGWVFTLKLALSSIVDILTTVVLAIKLRSSRAGSIISMDRLIDSMVLHTLAIGSLTSFGTVLSMICWLVAGYNRVFLGLHFMIVKLYANTLLGTLNTRKLRERRHSCSGGHALPVILSDNLPGKGNPNRHSGCGDGRYYYKSKTLASEEDGRGKSKLHVLIQTTVESRLDEGKINMPAGLTGIDSVI